MNGNTNQTDMILNKIYTTLLAECYKRDPDIKFEDRFRMTPNEVVDALTNNYEAIFCTDEEGKPTIESRIDTLEKEIGDIRHTIMAMNYSDAHFR